MKINVELNPNQKEIEIIIKTSIVDDNVNQIIEKLSLEKPKIIVGFLNDKAKILDEKDIIRLYSSDKKVFARTSSNEYLLKIPLYEAIERLNQNKFIRISNTEIININETLEFDLSFTGTICIKLSNGDISYVSRRYVSHIKKKLGIGGK